MALSEAQKQRMKKMVEADPEGSKIREGAADAFVYFFFHNKGPFQHGCWDANTYFRTEGWSWKHLLGYNPKT